MNEYESQNGRLDWRKHELGNQVNSDTPDVAKLTDVVLSCPGLVSMAVTHPTRQQHKTTRICTDFMVAVLDDN
jgi:hypothetical protein